MKFCNKCKINKSLNYFYQRKNGAHHSICKECKSRGDKIYYSKNREKIINQTKKYKELKKLSKIKGPGNYNRKNIEEIDLFVKNQWEGKCLSKEYKNNKTPLIFECKYNHQWKATWDNINKKKWCAICSSKTGERLVRRCFEVIFKETFNKARPLWMINSNNNRMELDGYCEKLNIAFEHQGLQHYQINEFSRNKTILNRRKNDDQTKIDLCNQYNVKLIIVPQVPNLIKLEDLKVFVINECKKQNITFIDDINNLDINYNIIPQNIEHYNQYKSLANSKGYQLISQMYINSDTKLKLLCQNNHEWNVLPANINKSNCPKCRKK